MLVRSADPTHPRLPGGGELVVTEIAPSRSLPHAFFGQAMASIPVIHPVGRILAERRFGHLAQGKGASAAYALVAYTKDANQDLVIIDGVLTSTDSAWSFTAQVPVPKLANALLLILEQLSRLVLRSNPT